jgi:bacterioferritin-associated ferredoxin
MCGAHPMGTTRATDEVIDAIADIEMQRQEMEREAGLAASCSSALRKLHELLGHEREALQSRGADAGHPENVEALTIEIGRVKGLGITTSQGPASRSAYRGQRKVSWRNAHRSPDRNKGRRTMGRAGGR